MDILDLFTQQPIQEVLKSTFLYSDKSEISFLAEKCNGNENFTLLTVKEDRVERKYVLVKIPKDVNIERQQQLKSSKVLCPVFVIENINKESYGAFEDQQDMKHFIPAEHNNLECLKFILENLAEHQALYLANTKEVENHSEYNIKDITNTILSLDIFKNLDTETTKQTIQNLQIFVNKLYDDSNLLVTSIGCPLAENVYLNRDENKCIFLNLSSTKIVPPVYDAMLYIFALSNEKFRKEHFEYLIVNYFQLLTTFLQKLRSNFADKITRNYSEHQVKVLLPIVKFRVANSLLKVKESIKLQEMLTNILYFLKYPLINQEDVYEVIKNKVGSIDYELIDYNLRSLSQKNGHLGEYFHLDIKIKVKDKEIDLELFAKFIKTSTDIMKEIVESGPAKKEDFFYTILIPLYAKYGLDSLLDFAPRCYLSRINWLLVLDDLSRQGYVSLKPNVPLNYEGLRASVENLAKLQACSIILEEILSQKSGKTFRLDEDYGEFLKETILLYNDGNPLKKMYDSNLELYYNIFEKFPEVTKKLELPPKELRVQIKKVFLSTFSKVKKSDTIRNAITHGDMYVGNMLFKFGENKLITNGMLIDLQILRYVTPTYDLLFFLFENSTKTTREKYFKVLIEEYYQYLSENIRKYNIEPEVVLPKKTFDENIEYMKSAAVMGALNYAHVTYIDPSFREEIFHDQEKFDYYINDHRDELVDLSWKSEHYRNIIKGLVEDIVDIIKNNNI